MLRSKMYNCIGQRLSLRDIYKPEKQEYFSKEGRPLWQKDELECGTLKEDWSWVKKQR